MNKIHKAGFNFFGTCLKVFIIAALFFAGCKARKQLVVIKKPVKDSVVVKAISVKELKLTAIRQRQTSFNTFSARAKANLDIGGDDHDVTLNIRIKKGEKIWVSVTAIIGIEVARALITPDSILVINRLQGVYLKKPFSYVRSYAGNKVSYKTLESLLVGNIVPDLINDDTNIAAAAANNTVLSGTANGLLYKLFLSANNKAIQTHLDDQVAGQSLQVNNSAFMQAGANIVPSQIDMASTVKDKKIQVNLHYTRMDFDKVLDYPFTIPQSYEAGN